jgi:hypothetical protein
MTREQNRHDFHRALLALALGVACFIVTFALGSLLLPREPGLVSIFCGVVLGWLGSTTYLLLCDRLLDKDPP